MNVASLKRPHQVFIRKLTAEDCDTEHEYLDQLLAHIERGLDQSPVKGDNVPDLCNQLADDKVQVHGIEISGTLVAGFCTYVEEEKFNRFALHVWAVGGKEMDSWLQYFLEYLKLYARYCDCTSVKFGGRVGWQRLLETHGYSTESIVMRCHI